MTEKQLKWEEIKNRLQKAGLFFLCLLTADIALSGAGRYITIGWFSPRILLTILTLICGLPLFLAEFKKHIKNPAVILLLIFYLYIAMEAVRGRAAGNPPPVWRSDLMGFAWMGLFPLTLGIIRSREDLQRVLRFLIAGASVQACLYFIFNIVFAGIAPQALPSFIERVWEAQWGSILHVEYNAVRTFGRSSLYMLVACLLLLGRIMKDEKINRGAAALFVLNFTALFYTYTRSLYLTVFASLLLAAVWMACCHGLKRLLLRMLLLAGCFLAVVLFFDVTLRQGSFQYAVARCFHRDLHALLPLPKTWEDKEQVDMSDITANSDNTRSNLLAELDERIAASPLIGHGLGATTSYIEGQSEYFYHDMLMRCGVIGLALFAAPFGYILYMFVKGKGLSGRDSEKGLMIIALIAFWIATYFNPWMNAAMGLTWYSLNLRCAGELPASAELKGDKSLDE